MSRFCPSCGNSAQDTDAFCPTCGTPLSPPVSAGGTAAPAPIPAPTPGPVPPTAPGATVPSAGFAPADPSGMNPAGVAPGGPTLPPTQKRRSTASLYVMVAAVVAILAVVAGTLTAISRGSAAAGASSPTASADNFVRGVISLDPVKLSNSVDPDEMSFATDVADKIVERFDKLGLPASSGNTDKVMDAVKLSVENPSFTESRLDSQGDVSKVIMTGGTVSARIDTTKLPSELTKELSKSGQTLPQLQMTVSATVHPDGTISASTGEDLTMRTDDGTVVSPFAISTKSGGRWYVSPMLTGFAYAATLSSDDGTSPLTFDLPSGYDQVKADTPSAAVSGMAAAGSNFNAFASSFTPTEARLLAAANQLSDGDMNDEMQLQIAVSQLSESKGMDGRVLVTVGHATVTGSIGYDDVDATLDGACITTNNTDGYGDDSDKQCLPEAATKLGVTGLQLATTKVDGQWRISVFDTGWSYLATVMDHVTDDQLKQLINSGSSNFSDLSGLDSIGS